MNLPFLRFFKKDKAAESDVAVAPQPPSPIAKPASERLGRTFMPNTARVVGVDRAPDFPLIPPVGNPPPPLPAEPRRISLGTNGAVKAVEPKDGPPKAESRTGERTIALRLADLLPQLPEGLVKADAIDPEHRVLLKAVEVERGMADGRPAVPLRSIYQQAPHVFAGEVAVDDEREVALPFARVLEQIASFHVRPDQVAQPSVPEVETPFLQVTQEDSERHGKPAAPIAPPKRAFAAAVEKPEATVAAPSEAEPAPPESPAAGQMKFYPATASQPASIPLPSMPAPMETPNAAPAPALPKQVRSIRLPSLSEPAPPPAPTVAAKAPAAAARPAPAPIALKAKISPNGTGGPAPERVPASSGPPVPTPLPSPFAPVRIPFKVAPPSNDLRPAPAAEEITAAPVLQAKPAAVVPEGPGLHLSLQSVLRAISPFQLSAPTSAVPDTAEIEIPFSIIEPQLSSGRIAISPAEFEAALPDEYRTLLKLEDSEVPVSLPLQEVLARFPNESLALRQDQETPEVNHLFETPFSAKAAEDAARLKQPPAPPSLGQDAVKPPSAGRDSVEGGAADGSPVEGSAPAAPDTKAAEPEDESERIEAPKISLKPTSDEPVAVAAESPTERSPLQVALETDETLDARGVVALASKLPGMSACAIVFSDGLSLAGNIPPEYGAEQLCALGPLIVRRVGEQMAGTHLGELTSVTLFCAKTPVSFFAHGNICLAALHAEHEISTEIRARLQTVVRELARTYAQPA